MATAPPLTKPTSSLPLHYALLLFPSFQALDVFGPLDALNTLKRKYESSLPLRLSILSPSLSPVSTYPSPTTSTGEEGSFTPFEQRILPTHTYTSPPSSSTHPIDILIIPGGLGTRLSTTNPTLEETTWKPLVSYLNNLFSTPSQIKNLKGIFTICTGSFLLGRSKTVVEGGGGEKGTLDGVRATTNKQGFLRAKEELPNVDWQPKARWVRTDLTFPTSQAAGGEVHTVKLWTTSGVSAGTDGIFALIEEEYGVEVAEFIANILEYERTTDPNDDPFAVEL